MFQKSDEKNDYIIEKDVVKKIKSQYILNGRTDFLVIIIGFLRFLYRT